MKMQTVRPRNPQQQERERQADGDGGGGGGSNGVMMRNSPHSSDNSCGFRAPSEIQLRSISKPSSSGS